MDPGNDIDDEIAGGYLTREFMNIANIDTELIFSIKTEQYDRLINLGITPFCNLNPIPKVGNINNYLTASGRTLTISFHNGTTFLPTEYKPDYILSIAPGLDSVITEANLVNILGFSHQGMPDTKMGFNDIGSVKIIDHIMTKGIKLIFTTPNESFNTLFGHDTFTKFNIPVQLWDTIARDAFKMIIGRMPPTVPIFVLPMAESLVNMSHAASINKPGTNSRLALAIRSKFTKTPKEITPDEEFKIVTACTEYADAINSAGDGINNPIKHYKQTIDSLVEMTSALAEMGMPYLKGERLIYSSDGNLASTYPEAFEEFKSIGIFTPAYDLIAAYKLCELFQEDGVFI
jgi:hypothetical protein